VTNRTGRLAAVTAMTSGKHRQALTRPGRIFGVEPGDQFLLDTVRFDYSTRQADRYGYRCRRTDQPKRKIEEPSLQQQRRQHWPEKRRIIHPDFAVSRRSMSSTVYEVFEFIGEYPVTRHLKHRLGAIPDLGGSR